MSIEVRRLKTDGEFEEYLQASIYAFNSSRDGSQLERYHTMYQRDWCLGAFDGGKLVAGLTLIPFEQHMLGTRIPLGGIATVASLPERRREGYVGALLRGALQDMHDSGQPLSGLYTPHYSLYRRFGWEIATRMVSYSFAPKTVTTRQPRPDGTFRRIAPDDWETLAALREPFMASRNGALVRTEARWRGHVFSEYLKGQHDAVVWSNSAGEPRGYAVYTHQHRQMGGPWGQTVLRVIDWIALDGEAYAALLNYLMGHDLADLIVMVVSEDEPLLAAFEEPTHITQPPGVWTGMLLRIVDVKSAFEARPSPATSGLALTIKIHDATAPWNDGVWRIVSEEGRLVVDALADARADVELDAVALGALYNGFMRPNEAARVGLLRDVKSEGVVDTLAQMLATPYAPFCPDDF